MIKTLIFDFGDVFINLDKAEAMKNALHLFRLDKFDTDMIEINIRYEIGKISTKQFIDFYTSKFSNLKRTDIIDAWNHIIKDFPVHRLSFIENLSKSNDYQLILLSNTNDLHINYIKENVSFYESFKACFHKFYLSQEIHLRKPNTDIFKYVLKENNLQSEECLFIDDTEENTDTAIRLGFHVWNIDETKEDVITLFKTKKELF